MNESHIQIRQLAMQEIQRFLSRTSEYLQTLNDQGVDSTNVLRERVAVGLESVQDQLSEAMESAQESALTLSEWIEQNPWAAAGVAAGLGAAAGCAATAGSYALIAPRRRTTWSRLWG